MSDTPANRLTGLPVFRNSSHTAPTPNDATARAANPQPRSLILDLTDHDDTIRELDYSRVLTLRTSAAERLSEYIKANPLLDRSKERPKGQEIIKALLDDQVVQDMQIGAEALSPVMQARYGEAAHHALFGLGRLQQHVDNDGLDEIYVNGLVVTLVYADGKEETSDPVTGKPYRIADSEEQLIEQIAFLAERSSRSFTEADNELDLTLEGGHRLAATAFDAEELAIVIRRHRVVDTSLGEMAKPTNPLNTQIISEHLGAFLDAAVKAGLTIAVGGDMGAGKTTMARALAAAVPSDEAIGTIETERELHLNRLSGRTGRIISWQARPGSGELNADGTRAGAKSLDQLLHRSFRFSLQRLFIGEVRATEALVMMQAAQAGAGTIFTIHAHSGRGVIERLETLLTMPPSNGTVAWARRQIAHNIDLIIHMTYDKDPVTGRKYRYVDEVIYLGPDLEDGNPSITQLYAPSSADYRAVPITGAPQELLRRLERRGGLPSGHFNTGGQL